MDPFSAQMVKDVQQGMQGLHLAQMIPRMLAAGVIGTALATRPWRRLLRRDQGKPQMVQAQILLCVAAAIAVAVIGDSVAKAFGLVGLGSFVRFRSGLKDPRDAAILFLLIGLGMACGHGTYALAFGGAALIAVALLVLDLCWSGDRAAPGRVSLTAEADDLPRAEAHLRSALGEKNVVVRSCALDFGANRLELEIEERVPGAVSSALAVTPGAPLRALRWSTLPVKGNKEEYA